MFGLYSCNQEIKINSFKNADLILEYDSEAIVGSNICAFVHFKNKKSSVKNAYYDCSTKEIKSIDEKNNKIIGCKTRLEVINDTIYMCITPGTQGECKMPGITVLYTDENGKYFIADTSSFIINVKPLSPD